MKKIRKSSFSGLIQYLTNEQGKQERVGEIRITNCQNANLEWAVHEINATQDLNQRAQSDKTYHLIISFPDGEIPSNEILKTIEDRVCVFIGFGEHQRISVIHQDTDNFHIHVAINKIHPTRHTLYEPYRAYKKLGEIATRLEIEYNLTQTNHIPYKVSSENLADDMEHHTSIGSLLNWIKEECAEQLKMAANWASFHNVLNQHGLKLQERGNGLVILNGSGIGVKASSVAREFSKTKLEQRFGAFEKKQDKPNPNLKKSPLSQKPPPRSHKCLINLSELQSVKFEQNSHYKLKPTKMRMDTTELYASFQKEQNHFQFSRSEEIARLRQQKNRLIEAAKRKGRLKRAAIKLLSAPKLNKKWLYALTSKTLKAEIEQAGINYLKAREALHNQYSRTSWADWLKLKALAGDVEALAVLRSREKRPSLKGDRLTGTIIKKDAHQTTVDQITKRGTLIYHQGNCAIRDDGDFLKLSRGSSNEGIAAALTLAIQRYGNCISVKGSETFKEQIAQTAAELKLNITFESPQLEQRHQYLLQTIKEKETNHEPRKPTIKLRRTNRSNNEITGTKRTFDTVGTNKQSPRWPPKPNIGRLGQEPPPAAKNRLRNLSELSLVQHSRRSEMLLPSHVPSNLEYERSQSDNRLRRGVSGAGTIRFISDAADKYIEEREAKRQRIPHILKHRRCNAKDVGTKHFAGTRKVDGEFLVLFKQDNSIIVLPVDEKTASKFEYLSIGSKFSLTLSGIKIAKGQSR